MNYSDEFLKKTTFMSKTKLIPILFLLLSNSVFSQRVVLLELFTNSSCPPCATNTPQVTQYVENNPSTAIAIAYHTVFPYNNDSMYHENAVENNARVAFYGVQFSPSTVADGNVFQGTTPGFLQNMATTVSNRAAVAAEYMINEVNSTLNGNMLNVSVAFESLGDHSSDSLSAHIVVVEETVQKSSYAASPGNNSETEYKYVMRKMLPGADGTFLQNRGMNGKDTVTTNWNLQHIKSAEEIRIVVFVQNVNTKEIYQAAFFIPTLTTSLNPAETEKEFSIYPNPADENLIIHYSGIDETKLNIRDLNGKEIKPAVNRINADKLQLDMTAFPAGMYIVQLHSATGIKTGRIILQ